MGWVQNFGNAIESFIARFFLAVGTFVARKPRITIGISILIAIACGGGFATWTTENRADKLWVPQDTIAEEETALYESYFSSSSRFNQIIVQAAQNGGNVLTKQRLVSAMNLHLQIQNKVSTYDDVDYTLVDLCTKAGGACANEFEGVCQCLLTSILKVWDYDVSKLENDADYMATLNSYDPEQGKLLSLLGKPVVDENGAVVSAEAFTISYLIDDRTKEAGSDEKGSEEDPINEAWEETVFLNATRSVEESFPNLAVDYLSGRSFADEFGGAITGDLLLVQISYVVVFVFLGANLGKFIPGPESRWTMSLAALILVGISTVASFGLSSLMGLFFGPVHSLLPFILLGIGVDDAFVIVNAFNRERKVPRKSEDNDAIAKRAAGALARAGASITVTSMTDLVAFGISASSSLPALASFCAYAAVGIVFLWAFASTFFTATLVLDERRQRDNRRECVCWMTRKKDNSDADAKFEESGVSKYFRNIHAPTILSLPGKIAVLIAFGGLLGFGAYGASNLSVENTQRAFIPSDSYLTSYINTADSFYPTSGNTFYLIFEGGSDIYKNRVNLANLYEELEGKESSPPYIADPSSVYRNVMTGMRDYFQSGQTFDGITTGDDFFPDTEAGFIAAMQNFASFQTGSPYASDVVYSTDNSKIEAIRVESAYVSLTKEKANGDIIDDAEKQIKAMDATREMTESWGDEYPPVTTYSDVFIGVEGFKIIKRELFTNVGLALAAVAVIVFFTVASPMTSIIITLNVSACIIEILGFMYALGIAIDSVSVINIVLAVGLSIDYSAHVGHCFMTKGGSDKNRRVIEALADIGAAVLSGATSTFLAVVVLLFSKSYVFTTLSKQFALTVGLGVCHGLILLPVLLSLLGPQAFDKAEMPEEDDDDDDLKLEVDA